MFVERINFVPIDKILKPSYAHKRISHEQNLPQKLRNRSFTDNIIDLVYDDYALVLHQQRGEFSDS
jgi:hypothetical protein